MSHSYLLAVVAMSIATYLSRSLTLAFLPNLPLPRILRSGLRYVPPGVIAALVVPQLIIPQGNFVYPWQNPDLLAGLVALVVALRTGNVLATVLMGVVTVAVLRRFIP